MRKRTPAILPAQPAMKISDNAVVSAAYRSRDGSSGVDTFAPAKPAPGVVPASHRIAMDSGMADSLSWASAGIMNADGRFNFFLGFPQLSELTQRTEYRQVSETYALEMTRKWIKIKSSSSDGDDNEKITLINSEFDRLDVKRCFSKCIEFDCYFGRSHLFLDMGVSDGVEIATDIGDGTGSLSSNKITIGSLKRLTVIEPMWAYPSQYNSTNPLAPGWYSPHAWFVMGKEVHGSRLLTFIGRPVPDMLKPAYSFGGISLSQLIKPSVDGWIRAQQSVGNLIHNFSTNILKTKMSDVLSGGAGADLEKRVSLFNAYQDNHGVLVMDKTDEDFGNVSVPISGLDHLQAQAQEHVASAAQIPLVKWAGLSPSGLNASSEGEIQVFYDMVRSRQVAMMTHPLNVILRMVQLSLFGEVDPSISFEFVPLEEMNERERAEIRKIDAETDAAHIDSGVISPEEARQRVAGDPETLYHGLNVDDMPDLNAEQAAGLVIQGNSRSRLND